MEEMSAVGFAEAVDRLNAAALALESAAVRLGEREGLLAASAEERVGRIVATVESAREAELERKLAEAEQTIAELRASAASVSGRKTSVAATMLAKGVGDRTGSDLGAVDAALASLSVEQRIAVKAEMLRSGLLR